VKDTEPETELEPPDIVCVVPLNVTCMLDIEPYGWDAEAETENPFPAVTVDG